MSDLGPIDSRTWPARLETHAVDGRRLFGYDTERDLAVHHRWSDVVLLSLVGDLADDARARAFEIAMCFAATMPAAEAPIHAAVLGRLCGVRTGGVLSTAVLTLAEHATALLAKIDAHDAHPAGAELPPELQAPNDAERESVAALRAVLGGTLDVPLLAHDPARDVAIVAVLRACGLTTSFQIVSALTLARLTSAIAEAGATKPGDFAAYPIDTPHFEYVGGER
jgi:hypothetical protein